jgi:predicted small integral membrane protein
MQVQTHKSDDRPGISPVRILKILFSAVAGVFLLLVGFTNLGDYATNLAFVRKVAGMEDLFTGEALRWRRVEKPWIHHLLYACIISWELFCGILAVVGAWWMFDRRRSDPVAFESASVPSTYAYGLAVVLWFGGFVTVAGEWFLMWRADGSDAQGTALLLSIVFLLLLLFHVAGPESLEGDGAGVRSRRGLTD